MFPHHRVAIHLRHERPSPINDSPDCRFLDALQHIERTVAADIAVSSRALELRRHSFLAQLSKNPLERGGSVCRSHVAGQCPQHFGIGFIEGVNAHVILDVREQPFRATGSMAGAVDGGAPIGKAESKRPGKKRHVEVSPEARVRLVDVFERERNSRSRQIFFAESAVVHEGNQRVNGSSVGFSGCFGLHRLRDGVGLARIAA